ncbi:MAG: hypothetical protein SPI12_02810 [Actinomycetaceae bacterium]|nr:hypothetical protein [Actinomycetaceae bacterium]MDY6082779.1 hypothetical protein [Actinomycetaceae bacterium]
MSDITDSARPLRRRRAVATVVLACVTMVGLSACSSAGSLPSAHAARDVAERPALTARQLETAHSKILDAEAAAVKSSQIQDAQGRVLGPFSQELTAQLKLKSILKDAYALPVLSTSVKEVAMTSAKGFPRFAVAITDPVSGSNTPSIDVLVQEKARGLFGMWAHTSMLPGTVMPAIDASSAGAQAIGAEDAKAGLVASPKAVIDAYVKLNSTGSDANGLTFASDALRTQLAEAAKQNSTAMATGGSAAMSFAAGQNAPLAVRTAEGGAVVVAQMDYTSEFKVKDPNLPVTLASHIGALSTGKPDGVVTVKSDAKAHYTVSVVFNVPPAEAKDKTIRVIAASNGVLTGVENAE